jgi:uncharacterized protein involved in oxidation of intracellular sulfur
MKTLIIINDAPYGSEKAYNGFRLANQLLKDHPSVEVQVFLMADAVTCAVPGQNLPNGFYNIERMLRLALSKGATVKLCGSCADARGLKNLPLVEGATLSTMEELARWVVESDRVLTF